MEEQPTMTVPTTPAEEQEPHAAVIEIVERHTGEKYPYTGAGSILSPNHLRIDGQAIWATTDDPATIEEIVVDGENRVPFAVTVSLLARAVSVDGESAFTTQFPVGDVNVGAVVEIPGVDVLVPGQELDRPYVLLNGRKLYTGAKVVVGKFATAGDYRGAARVTLTLLCRRLLIDDEPTL